jgi:hypothetical protein
LIIFDASTLILLEKIGLLQPVLNRFKRAVPEIIKKEVEYKDVMDIKVITQQIMKG